MHKFRDIAYREIEHFDKIEHFVAGAIVGVFFGIWWVVAVAAAKEVFDYFDEGHKPCGLDFVSTIVGGLVVCGRGAAC